MLTLLAGPGGSRLEALEAAARRRFFLVPAIGNGHVHVDHFEVLAQGKVDALRPEAPVDEGAAVELKLVELGLYDQTAGVGKVGTGYEVVVAGAAKLVGKKVTATVGRALDGVAYAKLAEDAQPATSPITFEAEAEKPTRAPRGKKESDAPDIVEAFVESDDAELDETPELDETDEMAESAETADTETVDAPELAEDAAAANGQPKKKRTRRGTRGGRGRKKASATTPPGDEVIEDRAESDGRQAPRIHVPPADLDVAADAAEEPTDQAPEADAVAAGAAVMDGAAPKRKRSRRGSRGGKKRRKVPTDGDEETTPVDDEPAGEVEPEPVAVGDAPEYVPMSEWIDDFGSRR